jgi:hypothetical protein
MVERLVIGRDGDLFGGSNGARHSTFAHAGDGTPTSQARRAAGGLDDLHAMLAAAGGWVPLGSADEQKPAAEGTVEAWGRSPDNPVGGWYGLKKGLRGRFANYVPPVMEALGLAEVEHEARNNRMRAA